MARKKSVKQIEEFLQQLDKDNDLKIDLVGLVDCSEINQDDAFDSIVEQIQDNNGFDVEIIYYRSAMEYLMEHDTSLHEAFELAHELGFETKSLNSEILASLVASRVERDKFDNLRGEIDNFFGA